MKSKMMMVTVLVVLVLSGVNAQGKLDRLMTETTPEERAELQTENMAEMLSLTDDQKVKVEDINLRYARMMESAYRSGGGKLQRFRQMKSVSEEKDKELKKVLEPTQYATYQTHKEEMKERIKQNAKENRNGRGN